MNLQLDDFEGPFDLLLHLVRSKKIDIYKINIRTIVEEYLEFIESIDKENIDASSEYLVMASELIHLKSRLLVNKELENNETTDTSEYAINSEEDLRNKIIEYEKYKDMTDTFRHLEENRQDYFTKIPENLNEYMDNFNVINSDVTIDDLVNALKELENRVKYKKPRNAIVTKETFSIKKRIREIRNILKQNKRVEFLELFDVLTKENVVVTLISLLDMSKNNEVLIKQDKVFSNIFVESVE